MKLDRVYLPYDVWEEIDHNMWGTVPNAKAALQEAIEFTSDHVLYGSYMQRVCEEWLNSCENALTDNTLNRKAWLGHAAVALARNIPEDITRKAWGFLTNEQRILANEQARRAIQSWEIIYIKDKGLCESVGEAVLF